MTKELKAQVDELGALEAELVPFKTKITRAAALRRIVADAVTIPAAESCELRGAKYVALVGPRQNTRFIISLAKLFRTLGRGAFLKACTFGVGKADELLTPEQKAELIGADYIGPRLVKTYEKAE